MRPYHSSTADLALICPHMGDGGVQRVISILANAWADQGRKVTVIALYRHEVFYEFHEGVRFISLPDWKSGCRWLKVIESLRIFLERVGGKIKLAVNGLSGSAKISSGGTAPAQSRLYSHSKMVSSAIPDRLLSSPRLRSLWQIHLPIKIRVRELSKAIEHVGAHNVISFCGSANITAVLACNKLPNHLIISERNDPSRQVLQFPWNAMRTFFYADADVVTANTLGAIEAMKDYVPIEKLAHVTNPIDFDRLESNESEIDLKGPRLLTVGRLHPQKAQSVLIEALAELPEELKSWRLSIVGQGELESSLRARAQALGVSQRIDWHGQVDNPGPYYKAADIFVLPSLMEGSPNALIEAMSFGLPVIVSDACPGPLELVAEGENGLVFPANDVQALAGKIIKLAREPELRDQLSAAAKLQVMNHKIADVLACWEALLDRSNEAWGERTN